MTADYSLWSEASRDLEGEQAALRMATAKVSVAGFWPFLALAGSEEEFTHRLALAEDHLRERVPEDLVAAVQASLTQDYQALHTQAWSGYAGDPEPDTADEESRVRSTDDEHPDDDPDEAASWRDLGGREGAAFFHQGRQRWMRVAAEEQEGGGNPYYFTGGPEGGPNTGQTNQFPPDPNGGDPVDPLNQMFPMQRSPWTVPPGGEWREEPMQFNPPTNRTASAEDYPEGHPARDHQPGDFYMTREVDHKGRSFVGEEARNYYGNDPHAAWAHYQTMSRNGDEPSLQNWVINRMRPRTAAGEHERCENCGGSIKKVQAEWAPTGVWTHTGEYGLAGDDDHEPYPGRGHTAANPNYFAGGQEGVAGSDPPAFPVDLAVEDPDDPINERYDHMSPQPEVDSGNKVANRVWREPRTANSPHNPPPNSGPLQGTEFDSPEERERWEKAQAGEQQDSRASTTFTGARHTADEHAPYYIRERDGGYDVVNRDGVSKGHHQTRGEAREQQKALYANVPGAAEEAEKRHKGSRRGFFDPTDPGVRMVAIGDQFNEENPFQSTPAGSAGPGQVTDMGSGGQGSAGLGGGGLGTANVPQTTPPRQMPSGGGGMDPAGEDPTRTARRVHADTRNLVSEDDPTGYGDEYENNVYERGGPLSTRPRQPADHRNVNTPQRPRRPIPTTDRAGGVQESEEEDDDRREAALVARRIVAGLVSR